MGIILFMQSGGIDFGYDINRHIKFKMRRRGSFQIGAFECCYNTRSQLIYRSSINTECHFLRKKNLSKIRKDFPTFYEALKHKALIFYNNEIRRPMNQQKLADIKQFEERNDYRQVLTMRNDFGKDVNNLIQNEMFGRFSKNENLSIDDAIAHNIWHIEKNIGENFGRTLEYFESIDQIVG